MLVPPRRAAYDTRRMLGEVISDRYRVTQLLATGGTSTVYLAQHVHMLKQVAIKVLDAKAEKLPELVARFQREAIAGAHVQHPNIASATDFGQLPDGSYFLVLEYVAGKALSDLIDRGPVAPARAVAIVRQIAQALGAAHEVGVIHRDVKPNNVMLVDGQNDVVKLIDFGFAQVRLSKVPTIAVPPDEPRQPEKALTSVGVVLGTVAYMAPEAALGMLAVDARSDLYALGLVLYELLAGKHPFEATEPVQLFLQQRTMLPPAIATRSPGVTVPPALEALVLKLLEKDPKDRYQSAPELIAALDAVMMATNFETIPELAPEQSPREPAPDAAVGGAFSMLESLIPRDGRFPRWAYIAFPIVVLFIATSITLLAMRPTRQVPSEGGAVQALAPAAPAESGTPSEAREVAVEVGGLDAAGWRMSLRNAARAKDWARGADAVVALLKLDPSALRDRDAQASLRNIAFALEQDGGEAADKFFNALTNDSGSEGLDVLYDIARFRQGTKAGKRATEILRRPEVMARASGPLKVIFDFREASCSAKRDLFPRMVDQGDDRALLELQMLRDAECSRRRDPCCFKENRALGAAIHALHARLSPAPTGP
jgi:serine/threonine protein kinase